MSGCVCGLPRDWAAAGRRFHRSSCAAAPRRDLDGSQMGRAGGGLAGHGTNTDCPPWWQGGALADSDLDVQSEITLCSSSTARCAPPGRVPLVAASDRGNFLNRVAQIEQFTADDVDNEIDAFACDVRCQRLHRIELFGSRGRRRKARVRPQPAHHECVALELPRPQPPSQQARPTATGPRPLGYAVWLATGGPGASPPEAHTQPSNLGTVGLVSWIPHCRPPAPSRGNQTGLNGAPGPPLSTDFPPSGNPRRDF